MHFFWLSVAVFFYLIHFLYSLHVSNIFGAYFSGVHFFFFQLDDLIRNAELQLKLLNEDKRNAYVTYQDLRSVPRFKNQTVMAINAPPEAKLQVPHPSEVIIIITFCFNQKC